MAENIVVHGHVGVIAKCKTFDARKAAASARAPGLHAICCLATLVARYPVPGRLPA